MRFRTRDALLVGYRCTANWVYLCYLFGMPDPDSSAAHPGILFEARNLTKTYRLGEVEIHALRGVDLTLFEGELVGMCW